MLWVVCVGGGEVVWCKLALCECGVCVGVGVERGVRVSCGGECVSVVCGCREGYVWVMCVMCVWCAITISPRPQPRAVKFFLRLTRLMSR